MVTATRVSRPYCVEISNGHRFMFSDTRKEDKGGDEGMRPHELLESALAACVCMSLDIAAERESVALPEASVEVTIDRLDSETAFNVSLRFAEALTMTQEEFVRGVVRTCPVARTLGKPIQIRSPMIVTI